MRTRARTHLDTQTAARSAADPSAADPSAADPSAAVPRATGEPSEVDAPGEFGAELEVVALGVSEWRVCDRRIEKSDGRRILGYIEHNHDGFEVLALVPAPSVCGTYDDWDTALVALVAENEVIGRRWIIDGIHIVCEGRGVDRRFRLEHDYDTTGLEVPEGPFATFFAARDAAVATAAALGGSSA